jgi:hypothetical protein|tara:strand:- start:947 stop:1261 length:315 start_codon:yes stop_codon:yes gene_type:complete
MSNNKWESIIAKFLNNFYIDNEIEGTSVTSIQTKSKKGGYCSITGMPHKYDQCVSFTDALREFKGSLTLEEAKGVVIGSETEDRADAEEHDEEQEYTIITISRK